MVRSVFQPSNGMMDRRAAVRTLLQDRGETLVVSGLGSPSYDLHAAGDHDANYYLWGAMGSAALVGLGLALAQPRRSVLVITGDGEQLMGFGGIATIAVARPRNLAIAVVDNEHYGETGMQASHTGAGVDLANVAAACGLARTGVVRHIDEIAALRPQLLQCVDGPMLYVFKVKPENAARSLPARDAVHIKNRFRSHLGLPVT